MKLATLTEAGGRTTAAARVGDAWHRLPAADLSAYLRLHAGSPVESLLGDEVRGEVSLPLPAPGKVVCCGLNYADHIAEMGRERPAHPTLFAKYADTLTGPADEIRLPAGLDVDWEAELAVVVGQDASVWGYTVANDVSIRDWQRRTTQWFQGKAWDRTTPLGPVVVTADELDPRAGLEVTCRVDGAERQRGNTRELVFDAETLVAYVSSFTRLSPGDLVLTGTPGGVGMGMTPPLFLAGGAVLETEISGIGVLRNRITFTHA
ncbi:MAG: fumarylacetoacetate hydrolase family protein [Nonomuraea sp.]|nr:fumarylacetoacetate hydrolase family protein [Nonomuraea sp.]